MKIENIDVPPGLMEHQYASERAIAALRALFSERIKRPGDAGARARIQLALLEAYSTVMAQERDNGITMGAISMGIRDGIADVVSSFVVTVGSDAPNEFKVEGVSRIFSGACERALEAVLRWRDLPDGEATGFTYKTTPTAKAD